ncbi:recombinase family protein [Chitinophaga rhizosphaerae]|uniref:recombinase family protein n=1 Tax=Chitinophaga rhizosphaerae TaxID=1864947 RepID=UPI000F80DE29|nr:recombinase family protein [Chitinophaga rhizosphaerae]
MVADLYIRVSTEEQKLTGFSQRYQEEILKSYCAIHFLTIGRVIFEDYSAKTFDRPAWKALLNAYRTYKLPTPRLLLVTKWDRFSRNTAEAYQMLGKLSKLGVEVRAIEQPVDMTIPENQMMLAFFLAVPEVENARRSLEIRKGQQRGITEGRWMGLAPYGYVNKLDTKGTKYIELIEMPSQIIRFAFQQLSTGIYSVTEVFHHAVDYGFNKSINCFWRVIRNPVYCGKIAVHKSGLAYTVPGQHEAVISEELFLKVQQILNRKKLVTRNTITKDLLPFRGLLLCPVCNRILTGSGSTGKSGKVYYYYHCHSLCHVRFKAQQVHEHLEMFIGTLHPTSIFNQQYKDLEKQLSALQLEKHLLANGKALKKVEAFKQKLQRLDKLLLEGAIELTHYKILKQECEAEFAIVKDAFAISSSNLEHMRQLQNQSTPGLGRLGELYTSLNAEKKKRLVSCLFPFGLTYTPNYLVLGEIAESLQIIFEKNGSSGQSTQHHQIINPSIFEVEDAIDSTILSKLITAIQESDSHIQLKQSREIASFFLTIAQMTLDL